MAAHFVRSFAGNLGPVCTFAVVDLGSEEEQTSSSGKIKQSVQQLQIIKFTSGGVWFFNCIYWQHLKHKRIIKKTKQNKNNKVC